MKVPFPRSACLAIWLALTGSVLADPVSIPLDKTLDVKGPKSLTTEFLPEGGMRFSYSITEAKKHFINLIHSFPEPVSGSTVTFELKLAQAEQITFGCVLQSGKKIVKKIEGLGPEWNSYSVDLATLASDEKIEIEPLQSIRLSIRANSQAGEQTVELRNWRLE